MKQHNVVRSTKPLTIPTTPHAAKRTAATTNRSTSYMTNTSSRMKSAEKDSKLKKSVAAAVAKKGQGGVTIPEPFKFTTKNKSSDKLIGCKSPVMSLAVQSRLFESSSLRQSTASSKVFSQTMKPTIAKSPKFNLIHKKPLPSSTADREIALINKRPTFKHNSVSKKVSICRHISHIFHIYYICKVDPLMIHLNIHACTFR
jgi:hypothetical protein